MITLYEELSDGSKRRVLWGSSSTYGRAVWLAHGDGTAYSHEKVEALLVSFGCEVHRFEKFGFWREGQNRVFWLRERPHHSTRGHVYPGDPRFTWEMYLEVKVPPRWPWEQSERFTLRLDRRIEACSCGEYMAARELRPKV